MRSIHAILSQIKSSQILFYVIEEDKNRNSFVYKVPLWRSIANICMTEIWNNLFFILFHLILFAEYTDITSFEQM